MHQELIDIRELKPNPDNIESQKAAVHKLDLALLSRGLVLIKMIMNGEVKSPKDWLFAQLRNIKEGPENGVREILSQLDMDEEEIASLLRGITACLDILYLPLILDEVQHMTEPDYGKYGTVNTPEWNLLQSYTENVAEYPVILVFAGTYIHILNETFLCSVNKEEVAKHRIILKLPFLESEDVLENLDSTIDLEGITIQTREYLGITLRGHPRSYASFIFHLIKERSSRLEDLESKDAELMDVISKWKATMLSDMVTYLTKACKPLESTNLYQALMNILQFRVFRDANYNDYKDVTNCIIPCKSSNVITFKVSIYDEFKLIEVNPLLESFILPAIDGYLNKMHQRTLVDVFVQSMLRLSNASSIGNKLDVVFIAAIIQKHNRGVQEELREWMTDKNFELPKWITPSMKFVTETNMSTGIPLEDYLKGILGKVPALRHHAIQPEHMSELDTVFCLEDDKGNIVIVSVCCTVYMNIDKSKCISQFLKTDLRKQFISIKRKINNNDGGDKKRIKIESDITSSIDISSQRHKLGYLLLIEDRKYFEESKRVGTDEEFETEEFETKEFRTEEFETEESEIKESRTEELNELAIQQIKSSSILEDYTQRYNNVIDEMNNVKQIHISVEIPYRNGKSKEIFHQEKNGDLFIVIDKRNAEKVFGSGINSLIEKMM